MDIKNILSELGKYKNYIERRKTLFKKLEKNLGIKNIKRVYFDKEDITVVYAEGEIEVIDAFIEYTDELRKLKNVYGNKEEQIQKINKKIKSLEKEIKKLLG